MNDLLNIKPAAPHRYILWAIIIPLFVRVLVSLFEKYRLRNKVSFWIIFRGIGDCHANSNCNHAPKDYWLSFLLGVSEMLAYPPLLKANQPTIIGAWLVLKTVHRVTYAPDHKRGLYNRYLLANVMILFASYFSARWWF